MNYLEEKRREVLAKTAVDPIGNRMNENFGPRISRFSAEIKKIEMKITNINYTTDKAILELEERKKEVREMTDPNLANVQQHIENIQVEKDKIIGKLLENKGIIDDRTASLDQIDKAIGELDREIARVQDDRDKATLDLQQRMDVIKSRLKSIDNLDQMIAALNVEIMEATGNFDKEMFELEKEKLAIFERADLSDSEKNVLVAELNRSKDDKTQAFEQNYGALMSQKEESLNDLAQMDIDNEAAEILKKDIADEVANLEALKIGASPTQLVEINRKIALAQQQVEEVELLRELNEMGLRFTPSGKIIDMEGNIHTIEEAAQEGLLGDIDTNKLIMRETLRKYGIIETPDGNFMSASGRLMTLEDLQDQGVLSEEDLKTLAENKIGSPRRPAGPGRPFGPDGQREECYSEVEIGSRTVSTASTNEEDLMSSEDVKYLKAVVGKPLTLALAEICTKQPRDPIHYLGHWLFKYRYNQEIDEIKKKEIMALEEERERIRKDKLHRDIEDAARTCLLEMVFRAHDDVSREQFEAMLRLQAMSEVEDEALAEEAKDVLGELTGPTQGSKARV